MQGWKQLEFEVLSVYDLLFGNLRKIENIGKDWKTKKSSLPLKQFLDDVKNDDLQKKNFQSVWIQKFDIV
jgi:hypothetical protein